MNPNIPNLDHEMTADELMAFWMRHQRGRKHRELIPDGGRGSKRTVADLANYASNKATAMRCRDKGMIETARQYEDICERIYNELPQSARW